MIEFFERFKKYPITLILWEKRANGYKPDFDMGKIITEQTGEKFLFIKGYSKKIPAQDFENMYETRGGKKTLLQLYSDEHGEWKPLVLKQTADKSDLIFEAKEQSAKFWNIVSHKDARIRWEKKSGLDKFLPIILIVGFGVAFVLMLNGYTGAMAEQTKAFQVASEFLKNISASQVEITKLIVNAKSGVITAPP